MGTISLKLVMTKMLKLVVSSRHHRQHQHWHPSTEHPGAAVATANRFDSSLPRLARLLAPYRCVELTSDRTSRSPTDSIAKFCPCLCLSYPSFEISQAVHGGDSGLELVRWWIDCILTSILAFSKTFLRFCVIPSSAPRFFSAKLTAFL